MTLQTDVIKLNEELAAKRVLMRGLFDGIDELGDDAKAQRASEIKQANDELTDLALKREDKQRLLDIEAANNDAMKAMREPVATRQTLDTTPEATSYSDEIVSAGYKSIAEMLQKSPAASGIKRGEGLRNFRGELGTLAIKTLLTSADLTPANVRLPDITGYATEGRTTVGDLLLPGTTSGQLIEYYEETTFTNSAAEVTEGSVKPESALAFTLRQDNVRKIGTWIPVTDEMLADVPFFESYLRQRLGFMVKQREEQQLINGNGTAPNIRGILNRTGIQVVTGYAMSTIDSIFAAMTEVRVDAFSEPNAMVVHPRDWFDIRTSKDTTGNYLLGPATSEGDEIVWGLRIVQTTAIPQNTGLVGDFRQGQVFRRSGIDITISSEHSDYFIYNKLAVLAEERLALAVYRPAAFCKVEALVVGS
jgi:HK97 family phage major capsid protein